MTAGGVAPPPTGQLPWGTTAEGELDSNGVKLGAVIGTLAVFFTFPLGILGIVLNCMGLDRIQSEPEKARKLLMWSWITFIPGTVLGVAALLWLLVALIS